MTDFQNAASDLLEPALEKARGLTQAQKIEEALAAWSEVESLAPGSEEAANRWAALKVEQSRRRHGLGSDGARWMPESALVQTTDPDAVAPAVTSAFLMEEVASLNVGVKRTPIQQLELAVRERPSIPELYLQLTQLYLESGRDYDAERLLTKGRDATDDPRVRRLWEDVTMLRLDKKIDQAARQVELENTPEARRTLEQLRTERERTETDFFYSRAKAEPGNAEVHFQFGQRLKRSGKLEEACQQLESAVRDMQWRSLAAYELAECQRLSGELPQALRNYRLAAESALPGQWEHKKQALYKAGALAARMKLFRLAQRYLADLLKIDPSYKDAAAFSQAIQQQVV